MRALALAVALLVGCGSDDAAPPTTTDDGGFLPADGLPQETTPDTAPAVDSAPVVDSTTAPTDTATTSDAPSTTVKCGAVTCQRATQDCCVTGGNGACVPTGSGCAGSRYSCTSVDECASGQVCCASGAGTGGASCAESSGCVTTTTCKSNADCTGKLKTCTDLGHIKICSA